jgi:hypothetical protein
MFKIVFFQYVGASWAPPPFFKTSSPQNCGEVHGMYFRMPSALVLVRNMSRCKADCSSIEAIADNRVCIVWISGMERLHKSEKEWRNFKTKFTNRSCYWKGRVCCHNEFSINTEINFCDEAIESWKKAVRSVFIMWCFILISGRSLILSQ